MSTFNSPASRFMPYLAALMASGPAISQAQQSEAPRFIRVQRDFTDEPARMQTAIVRFQSESGDEGLTVDLVAAVHIGDAEYYAELNRRFQDYDVVLYELVANRGDRPGETSRSQNPVSMMQGLAQQILKLDSQLEQVDYTADNFVHADMTPQEIGDSMKARGDTGLSVGLDVLADLIRQTNKQQQQASDNALDVEAQPDLFDMLLSTDRDVQLKRMMAKQFASMGSLDTGLGPTLNRMLIDDRNTAAMRVLQQQVAKGHKKIAIFYGAAHMLDFAGRLRADFGLTPTQATWLTAWDLRRARGVKQQLDPISDLLELLD